MPATDRRVTLGRKIRALRALRGWRQTDLAQAAGMQRAYIGAVERGERNLSLHNLERIADALDVTLADLFSDDL